MLDINLKNEWLEKVKIQKRQDIHVSRGRFSIHTELYFAPDEVKADYDVNLTAALIGKEFLWNIHENFRKDKKFILELINNKYSEDIYSSLDYFLCRDKELFLKCVERKDNFKWGINNSIYENDIKSTSLSKWLCQ